MSHPNMTFKNNFYRPIMVLKIGIKRTRDLGMFRPSRAYLEVVVVLASLNCSRA
jgi:hypothetical protein